MTIPEEQQETDGPKASKISPIELIKKTAYQMVGKDYCGDDWTPFPATLVVLKSASMDPLYYKIMPGNVLERLTIKNLSALILLYWQRCPATAAYKLTPEHARMTIDFFYAFSKNFEEPIAPIMFKSDIGYCYHRLAFDPAKGAMPTFDEIIQRTGNAQAMMAFIGSLFEPLADRQQYLWLYSDGETGKGALARFLAFVLQGAYLGHRAPLKDDRFWLAPCVGKRLVVIPECDNYNFVNNAQFKMATGGDKIPVEEKGQPLVSVSPTWKFIVSSNEKPSIVRSKSSIRRVIFCEMGNYAGKKLPERAYDALLQSEAPAILYNCFEAYRLSCPNKGEIPNDKEILEELVREGEESFDSMARRWLNVWPKDALEHLHFNERPSFNGDYFDIIRRVEKDMSEDKLRRFKVFLRAKYGIHRRQVSYRGEKIWRYINAERNDGVNTEKFTYTDPDQHLLGNVHALPMRKEDD